MNGLQDRIDSFLKAKRVKSIKKFMKWPHPLNDRSFKATPEALAEAGFYYNPSASQKDNVTCFMCNKSIGAWEEEDDPFEFHYKACGQECDWAFLRCGLRRDVDRHGNFVFPDKTRLPRSKTIERARRATFKDWGHENPSADKMAQAGFVYTPMQSGDDLATCLYCNVALSGWDPDDDPIEEHRKREARNGPCPFFHPPGVAPATNSSTGDTVTKPPSRSGSARPASRTSVKPPSRTKNNTRTTSAHQDILHPTKIHDGDEDSDYNSTQSANTGDRRMSRAPGKRVASGASRSRSKGKQLADVEEEQGADEPEEEIKPRGKRKTTVKSKIVIKEVEVEDDTEEPTIEDEVHTVEEEVKDKPKRGRGRPRKTKPVEVQVDSREDVQVAPPKPKAKKKGRRTKAKAPEPESKEEQELEIDEEDVSVPTKSRTKGKGRPKVSESEDEIANVQRVEKDESEVDEEPTKQQHPSNLKNPSLFTSDHVSSAELPPSSSDAEVLLETPSSRKQSANAATGDVVAQEDIITSSDEEEVLKSLIPGQDDITMRVSAPAVLTKRTSSSNPQPQVEPNQNVTPPARRRSSANKMVQRSSVKTEQQPDPEPIPSRPLPPPPRDPTPPAQDVDMQDRTQDVVTQEQTHPERFVTPPKQVRSLPVPRAVSPPPPQQSTTVEPLPLPAAIEEEPVYPTPPLSLLPFTPLTSLTSAELDMTVEEWIRYQIGVEYDKLKRDGMRELEKFKKKADDVRKMIDGL